MPALKLSVLAWKWLLSILIFCSALLLASELRYAWHPLMTGEHGSLGVVLQDQGGLHPEGQDSHQLRITQLDPASPLRAAGARAGDVLSFVRPVDRWRKFQPGEEVALMLRQGDTESVIRVVAYPVPIRVAEYVDYLCRAFLILPALLFSLLIGFKGASVPAYHSLALTFIALSLNFYYNFNYSPGGPIFLFSKLANLATYSLIWYGGAVFALHYQDYGSTRVRVWLTHLFPWYRAVLVVIVLYSLWHGLGHETPGLWLLGFIGVMCGLLVMIASLVDGLRQSAGEIRQRHLWLLLSVSVNAIPSFLTWVPAFDWSYNGVLVTVVVSFVGQFLMFIGLTYAVLRHRIFNFNFAISRALIFSTISLLLLCAFGLVKWLIEPFLHAPGQQESTPQQHLFDAVIAVCVYLVFHQLHGRVENFLERVFFKAWHDNEKHLRNFIKSAAHIVTADALLAGLVRALDRFTGGAGVSIYLLQPDGGYILAASNIAHAPAKVHVDDGLIVALRSEMSALRDTPVQSVLQFELALPMSHRGFLNGFVVLGLKGNRSSYRPDETALLSFAVQQVGLDLLASRVAAPAPEMHQLELLQKAKVLYPPLV